MSIGLWLGYDFMCIISILFILACGSDEFTCGDGSCIEAARVCDGTTDCLNGLDEKDCPPGGCILLELLIW